MSVSGSGKVRWLVIDDSPSVRRAFAKAFAEDAAIEVVGAAGDALEGWELIQRLAPDVVSLDLEMPVMDGLEFLKRLMRARPTPVVMVSSLARHQESRAHQALELGAVSVLPKPHQGYALPQMLADLRSSILEAANARVGAVELEVRRASSGPRSRDALIAVGSSTGGTVAFEVFAKSLAADHPCVLLAQHLPGDFVTRFVQRLDEHLPSQVRVAQGDELLAPGRIFVAPATHHLTVQRQRGRLMTQLVEGEPVNHHRPSVDVLFDSVAAVTPRTAVGVMLTGMGADGAKGMLAMRQAGAATLAQDERSCVVYGMPRAAVELGAVQEQHPPGQLAVRACEVTVLGTARV